jgi:hypothetical protein
MVDFDLAFWHPFGAHTGESPAKILARKRREIQCAGQTLWSFQQRPMLDAWHRVLVDADPSRVLVFCSEGRSSQDPYRPDRSEKADCRDVQLLGEEVWERIGEGRWRGIRVPHSWAIGRRQVASAFVVQSILPPDEDPIPTVQAYHKDGSWQPPRWWRPDYLIRRAKGIHIPRVSAILELKRPYLARIRTAAGAGE